MATTRSLRPLNRTDRWILAIIFFLLFLGWLKACTIHLYSEFYTPVPIFYTAHDMENAKIAFLFSGKTVDAGTPLPLGPHHFWISGFGERENHEKLILNNIEVSYGDDQTETMLDERLELEFEEPIYAPSPAAEPLALRFTHVQELNIPFVGGEEIELRIRGSMIHKGGETEVDIIQKYTARQGNIWHLIFPLLPEEYIPVWDKTKPPM